MLNREQIIEKVNAKYGCHIDCDAPEVIGAFVDLDMLAFTDEDMVYCIESGCFDVIGQDVVTLEEVFDPERIARWLSGRAKPEPKDEVAIPAPNSNPFGMFEQAITQVVGQQSIPMVKAIVEERLNKWVEENGSKIVRPIQYVIPETGQSFEDVVHERFEDIVTFVQCNEPLMIVGPAGTGKNHLCKQVADFLGLDFYFANAITQEHKLTGFIDANGVYHETQFYKAMKNGGLFMFDEIDASDPEVLVVFNAALANGYFDFPVGRVDAHENFRVIAAANTTGNGASYEYVGRNQLDTATLDRFGMVRVGYSPRIEQAMTDDAELLDFIHEFRQACDQYGIRHVASYRGIKRCDKLKAPFGYIKALKSGLLTNLEPDDLKMLVKNFNDKVDNWSAAFCDIAEGRC